jgi:peroxiredoxin
VKTTNFLRSGGSRLLLRVGTAVAVLCLGVGGWIAARPKPPDADKPVRAVQATGKHFTGTVHFDVLAKLVADDRRASANDWLRELADPKASFRVETQNHPLHNRPAPVFTLHDHVGQAWSLQEQLTRGPLVLVFYLGYSCPACVRDLIELNADLERFRHLGAEVVAVSGDSPEFTRQQLEKYGALGFAVLSDPGHAVAQSYGLFRPANAPEPEEFLHGTFLIGRDGQVRWAHRGDTPFRNNKALLYELARNSHLCDRLRNKLRQVNAIGSVGGKQASTP